MIIDSYDKESPAKINVKKNENAVQVDVVIYTFSQEIEKYVTDIVFATRYPERYNMADMKQNIQHLHGWRVCLNAEENPGKQQMIPVCARSKNAPDNT